MLTRGMMAAELSVIYPEVSRYLTVIDLPSLPVMADHVQFLFISRVSGPVTTCRCSPVCELWR